MKRKLRLLLAMVLAMTMVMGIGVTVLATEPDPLPEGCPERVYPCTCEDAYSGSAARIVYVYGFDTNPSSGEPIAKTAHYDKSTGEYQGKTQGYLIGTYFKDEAEIGRIYHLNQTGKLVLCACNAPHKDEPQDSAHTHNFQWQTITTPTTDADGLEGEVCTICGATRNTQSLSAYGYALNDYAVPMINAAKSGQTITLEFGEWNSFPKSFMAKLVDKSAQNVTFVFHYKWNHVKQEITIPAGTPIDLNFDWYGPAKMAELYGAN